MMLRELGRARRLRSPALPLFFILSLLACWVVASVPALAHFRLDSNIRIVHVRHTDTGLRVMMRLPMPLVVAGTAGETDGPPPYTRRAVEDGQTMHYADVAALRADPEGLGHLVAVGHRLTVDGRAVMPSVEAVRAYPAAAQPRFATLAQAEAALDGPAYPAETPAAYVGSTVIDVALAYRTGGPVYGYEFSSTLDPGLPGQDETANLLLDHGPAGTETYRARGPLTRPVAITGSPLAAAATFVADGARHVLSGFDHVLFVLCLTIGAFGLGDLVRRVTGFTVGHTVTLAAGVLGYAPTGAWFMPLVETAIALSIIYAGAVALMKRPGATTFAVSALIGLLHGFGFSFALRETLRADAPDLWPSLLSFNVGVELGQLAVVLAVWPVLLLADARRPALGRRARIAVVVPCIAIAALWTGERLTGLVLA